MSNQPAFNTPTPGQSPENQYQKGLNYRSNESNGMTQRDTENDNYNDGSKYIVQADQTQLSDVQ